MTSTNGHFKGIYDVPTAARYLLAGRGAEEAYPISSRGLIRWIRNGLALPDLASVPGKELLIAFEDLVSMRVIAALRSADVSWRDIHWAEEWLRQTVRHPRPFATEQLWTSRSDIFTRFQKRLISASKHGQLAMEVLIDHLIPVSGLRFERRVARRWEAHALVTLDPKVQFGAPCIADTRIPTRSIWGMIAGGDPHELVRRSYEITDEELDAALAWEERLAA